MKLKASDFKNENYDCQLVMETLQGEPVLILNRKAYSPLPWLVVRGPSNCFFATRKEAIDFCEKHGYGVAKPPRGSKNRKGLSKA
ncbi:MAG: hypothetical protein WBK46_18785 [Ruminococcus flavefaciens]